LLTAVDVTTGAEAVMEQATAWVATLAMCDFILLAAYVGVVP
jgi:hypothetical protein